MTDLAQAMLIADKVMQICMEKAPGDQYYRLGAENAFSQEHRKLGFTPSSIEEILAQSRSTFWSCHDRNRPTKLIKHL